MVAVKKIDSNQTGLRYAQETSIGVVSGGATWYPLEPNEYDDFGGEITTVARNPINASRQRLKGVTVDLDASGGFSSDLTQKNLQDILQGFMFASTRRKAEQLVTVVDIDGGNPDEYEVADTTGFVVGMLIQGQNFTNAGNNGVHPVTAIVSNTSVEVATGTLTAEGSPPATAKIVGVGYKAAAGVLDITNAGAPALPTLTSDGSAPNFTQLGLVPGEWIYIGGDAVGSSFTNAGNNGWARIYSIAAGVLTFDKTSGTMVTEASTTEEIEIYFGHVLKNESDPTLIVRRSYQLERTLGAPDDASPSQIQSEYLVGSVANELTLNFSTADKITVDLSFIGTDHETRSGVTGVKAGTRPALVSEDAFNTSNDFSRLKMTILDRENGSNPSALFAYLTEFTVTINNNVSPNKAISVLGAFDMTAGQFEVAGDATAYFADVAAVAAVRNNEDVTLDFALVKNNAGIVVDVPLVALGNGRLDVSQDEPITLPLENPAAADRVFNHTLLFNFFDYLPDVAG